MSEETVVPFLNAAAKRANDAMAEHKRGMAAQQQVAGDPNVAAIENLLGALEGMQAQLQALIELVGAQDTRIDRLEKSKPGRIITGLR